MKRVTERASSVLVDHQARAMLALIAGWNPHARGADISDTMNAARQMLAHPQAFDDPIDSPQVIETILAMLRVQDAERRQSVLPLLDAIKDGEDLPVGIDTEGVGDLIFQSITQAAVLGGALMYQMLKGGAR